MAPRAGTGTTYEVVRGDLSDLRATGSVDGAPCLAGSLGDAFLEDFDTPPSGDGFYFVVRAANSCGDGGWGSSSGGTPRSHASCP
jgi:hypothetical protein